jgi:hypothetical protein
MATEGADTTAIGFRNKNGRVVVRNTGKPGTDHLQYIYQLACSKCGNYVQTAPTFMVASVQPAKVGRRDSPSEPSSGLGLSEDNSLD